MQQHDSGQDLVCGDRSIPVQRKLAHTSRILTVLIGRLWPTWTGPASRQSSGNVLISWSPKLVAIIQLGPQPSFVKTQISEHEARLYAFETVIRFPCSTIYRRVSLALVRLEDFHLFAKQPEWHAKFIATYINRLRKKFTGASGAKCHKWRGQTVHILPNT